jgi:hypothetical protein
MKNYFTFPILVSSLLVSSVLFSGCVNGNNEADSSDSSTFEQKNATITISGKLTKSGNLYLITDTAGVSQDVETYSVDLDTYVDKSVTVSGQYSGDTLFVSEISE